MLHDRSMTPTWAKPLEPYFRTVLSSQSEGWHEFRVMIRREEDGSVLLYMPILKELR